VRNNIVQAFNPENPPFPELDLAGQGSVPGAPGTATAE
jgi:hypothetical protein